MVFSTVYIEHDTTHGNLIIAWKSTQVIVHRWRPLQQQLLRNTNTRIHANRIILLPHQHHQIFSLSQIKPIYTVAKSGTRSRINVRKNFGEWLDSHTRGSKETTNPAQNPEPTRCLLEFPLLYAVRAELCVLGARNTAEWLQIVTKKCVNI